jgi:hypothetical protein
LCGSDGQLAEPEDAGLMHYFYVSINPWSGAVFVKTEAYFIQQGGLRAPWGKTWKKIRARSIEDARRKGEESRGPTGF